MEDGSSLDSNGWVGWESDSSIVGEEFTSSRVLFHLSFNEFSMMRGKEALGPLSILTVLEPGFQQTRP